MKWAVRIFLVVWVAAVMPFSVFIFFKPNQLQALAGVIATGATGVIELRVMYGGLQFGYGLLSLVALFKKSLVRPALLSIAFLTGSSCIARVLAAMMAGGLPTDMVGVLGSEVIPSLFAATLLWRLSSEAAA